MHHHFEKYESTVSRTDFEKPDQEGKLALVYITDKCLQFIPEHFKDSVKDEKYNILLFIYL